MKKSDKVHYDLGWDFALYRRGIPEEAASMFIDGHRAFRHGNQRATRKATLFEKKWLQIRWNALLRDKYFDPAVDPDFIRLLMPRNGCCPVTNEPLTFAEQKDTDWSVERAANELGYIPGNLIVISSRANAAKGSFGFSRIRQFASGELSNDRLSQKEWQRLAELVEPMNRPREDGRMVVDFCRGQKIAPGTETSACCRFQYFLSDLAIVGNKRTNRLSSAVVCDTLANSLCRTKHEVRAFRQLWASVRRRALHVPQPDRVWKTPKVQKKFFELLKVLGENRAADRIRDALSNLDENLQNHPAMAKARSRNSAASSAT